MKDAKEHIAASIMRARTDLEQALADLEKLPLVEPGSVAFIAHALNNYLTVTEATIQLLTLSLADHGDPSIGLWLGNLQHATGLMTRAVNQLMNSAVTPDTKLRFAKVDVALGLQRLCGYYQAKAEQKQIRIICGPFVDLPPVWTDRVAVGAVLDNLLSNAMKYSPADKNITLAVLREQDSIVCRVCDEGPGLSQEDQAQLFQPGVRLSPVPTGGEPSTGYGLAVAKALVEQLGGQIWCESTPGQGACFFVRLPAYREEIHGPEPDAPGSDDVSEKPGQS
jgi:signal transduction histidine kinase